MLPEVLDLIPEERKTSSEHEILAPDQTLQFQNTTGSVLVIKLYDL